jgi:mono/diheme cytochrome c family protein
MTGAILIALWIVAAGASMRAQDPQETSRSVIDGVYTDEQAKRGEALYGQFCASCHGPALTGGEMAPSLVGGDFTTDWVGLTVNDLFERIRLTMPQDTPGSLSRQQNADVLAFMLKAGRYPVGETELPKETEVLKTIKFEAPKPAGGGSGFLRR